MAAATLTANDVMNSRGESLGDIEAIMLDVPSGRVAYAVLSFGGFLGVGDKLFAVPWRALKLDTDNRCFILDVDKDRLRDAPGFDKDHWLPMADTSWASRVHSYYGTRRADSPRRWTMSQGYGDDRRSRSDVHDEPPPQFFAITVAVTTVAACTSARPPARTSAATCTGIRRRRPGTAPVTAHASTASAA